MEHFHVNHSSLGLSYDQETHADYWTFEENKAFEIALANISVQNNISSSVDLIEKIGEISVPGKTADQIRKHLELLIHDVNSIESNDGPIYHFPEPLPVRSDEKPRSCPDMSTKKKGFARWTKEEHEKFLLGLEKYGRGDWKNISRYIVTTKSPTQVASHAQKYFIRLAKQTSSSSSTPKPPVPQTINPPKSADDNSFIDFSTFYTS